MRSTWLITGTNELQKYVQSLANLGVETTSVIYDAPGTPDSLIVSKVKETKPDLIVYIGSRWGQQPSFACLTKLAQMCPSIHLCSDAADRPWHDHLRDYDTHGCFTLQVAIDGNDKWPGAERGITCLTPVDPALFPRPKPHAQRGIVCGYAGNPGAGPGSVRTAVLVELLKAKVIDMRARTNLPYTYESFCDFLANCRMSLNVAYSGSEKALQVKGRVLESALAGALLLESRGSPTSRWFKPGVEYLEYGTPEEVVGIIRRLEREPELTQQMGEALRKRVLEEHHPRVFWTKIYDKLGLCLPSN